MMGIRVGVWPWAAPLGSMTAVQLAGAIAAMQDPRAEMPPLPTEYVQEVAARRLPGLNERMTRRQGDKVRG